MSTQLPGEEVVNKLFELAQAFGGSPVFDSDAESVDASCNLVNLAPSAL